MKKTKIKRFFKLLFQGKDAYPKLCKLMQHVDALLLSIIQALLSFFGLCFFRHTSEKPDARFPEESVCFKPEFHNFINTVSFPFFSPNYSTL